MSSGEPWASVVLDVAASAGVSVVLPKVDDVPVHLDVTGRPAHLVFRELADMQGMAVSYADGIVRFTSGDGFAECFGVFPAAFEGAASLAAALQLAGGSEARVEAVGDRVAVSASESSMRRVLEVVRQLSQGPDGWVLEVVVTRLTEAFARELGVDWTIGARARLAAGATVGDMWDRLADTGASVSGTVEAVLRASEDGREATVVSRGTLYLLEGRVVRLQQGDVVPIPQRTVSNEGVVTVTGYSQVRTGFTLEATGRRVSDGLLLELTPRISAISGYVDGYPVTAERSVDAVLVVRSGEWVVVSGLDEFSTSSDSRGSGLAFLGGSRRESGDESTTLVMVRATRVFAGSMESVEVSP